MMLALKHYDGTRPESNVLVIERRVPRGPARLDQAVIVRRRCRAASQREVVHLVLYLWSHQKHCCIHSCRLCLANGALLHVKTMMSLFVNTLFCVTSCHPVKAFAPVSENRE